MADSLSVYSAREVVVAWGLVNMEGFSSDNILSMEYNSDLTSETVSADGKLATAITPDRTGTVTVEIMQTSKTNMVLSGILAHQNNLEDTSDIVKADFAVADPSGSVLAVARNAYIKKAPSIGLGVEQSTYEWTFCCEKLEFLSTPRGVEDVALAAEVAGIITGMVALGSR